MTATTPRTFSMTGPIHNPPSRTSSLRFTDRPNSSMSLKGMRVVSNSNINWKSRRSMMTPELGSTAMDMGIKRFDGAARTSTSWDGLRKDPELWFPDGNCLVHLYDRGLSRRGPAFKLPMDALISTSCLPLLDRCMAQHLSESPLSEMSNGDDDYFSHALNSSGNFELYIPAPPCAVEREQAFIYHAATRNFFAWIFGKSIVGSHLGGALVGLLNSLNEFRSPGEDNVQAIMDYMDEEGYADLRNSPDHALAVLFFAEHFQFKDMWIDAFAHCTGMHERLVLSQGFGYMSRTSRALITRSRFEMDMRLEEAGKTLGSFLAEDLSDAHLGLSTPARSHLDKFRSFLLSYYVAKLGYYPPTPADGSCTAFPKNIYGQMCQEFQKLYDYLVDSDFTASDVSPTSQLGGICALQSVQAFDSRHKYQSLLHPLPLLPEGQDIPPAKIPNRRMSWYKPDKMKPDPRLITFASLSKASNCTDQSLLECSLVRAYRGFEKDCVFSPTKGDKSDKLSHTDARKVRWILIYGVLQTLLSATNIPVEVRDWQNVSYDLSVLTAGCPTWKDIPAPLFHTQTDQMNEDFADAKSKAQFSTMESEGVSPSEIKPDIDYFAINHRPQAQAEKCRPVSMYTLGTTGSFGKKKGTVKKALSTLGNMPELRHPSPKRPIYHEILVHGYGNGTNTVNITSTGRSSPVAEEDEEQDRKQSSDSSAKDISSRWSNSSFGDGLESPTSSLSSGRDSDEIKEFLDSPMSDIALVRVAGSDYSESMYEDSLQPNPLQVKKGPTEGFMRVTTEVKVEWEDQSMGEANDELLAYLNA